MRKPFLVAALLVAACSDEPTSTPDVSLDSGTDAANSSDLSTRVDSETDAGVELAEPFSMSVFDNVRLSSIREDEHFQQADSPFDLGQGPFARVVMRVELDSTCYPFDQWTQPPEGHRWPSDCDAYDRNFEFVMDPAGEGEAPGFELVRAITPFGGPMEFEVDITDLANAHPGAHTMRVHITTWSDGAGQVSGSAGGWNVTTSIDVEPGVPPRNVLGAVSVFNGNLRADSNTLDEEFDVPEGTNLMRVDYRVTGHGGGPADAACIGHADEFCERNHYPAINGAPYGPIVPWRSDCESLCTLTNDFGIEHCRENPCGSIASVRAPRANWCPGSVTPPIELEYERPPQRGSFSTRVDGIAEGGSWRTSATVFFYGE